MTVEKMSVHKALAELKLLENKVLKAVDNGRYCGVNKHSADKINGITLETFAQNAQSAWDKANDLIKRYMALKRAVNLSNAQTKVFINGVDYTVAEAIAMKSQGIGYDQYLLTEMKKQLAIAEKAITKENSENLEKRADAYIIALHGAKEGKTNTTEIEKQRAEFIASNTMDLIDPLKISDKIEELQNKIDAFMTEVDAALSVSNAITEITIEY